MTDGRAFEAEVFPGLRQALKRRRFGLLPNMCSVPRQRASYSRERDAEIVVDLAIELVVPNATTPALIWVCECKDYSHFVPVTPNTMTITSPGFEG